MLTRIKILMKKFLNLKLVIVPENQNAKTVFVSFYEKKLQKKKKKKKKRKEKRKKILCQKLSLGEIYIILAIYCSLQYR